MTKSKPRKPRKENKPGASSAAAATSSSNSTNADMKYQEEIDKLPATVLNSNLNPNAKEFIFNPNAQPFMPSDQQLSSTPPPPWPKTPLQTSVISPPPTFQPPQHYQIISTTPPPRPNTPLQTSVISQPATFQPPQQHYQVSSMEMTKQGAGMYASQVPPGLEYLVQLDQVQIEQILDLGEVLFERCIWKCKSRYSITDVNRQEWGRAFEDSSCISRKFCGKVRPFTMKITNNQEVEILRFERSLACTGSCFPCCLQSVTVSASGLALGSVHQDWSYCTPLSVSMSIRDPADNTLFKIKGPCCPFSCRCSDVDFMVLGNDGQEIGKISKKWTGCCREACTDCDNFALSFPLDLCVKAKALLLGATILLDFIFFET